MTDPACAYSTILQKGAVLAVLFSGQLGSLRNQLIGLFEMAIRPEVT